MTKKQSKKTTAATVVKPTQAKKAQVKADKATAGKPKAETAKEAKVDAFGSRIGSLNAKVNAMLSKTEPVTMADITKKLGCKTKYNHLGDLIEKKLVVKGKDGYLLVK
jgi:hypothetical protein